MKTLQGRDGRQIWSCDLVDYDEVERPPTLLGRNGCDDGEPREERCSSSRCKRERRAGGLLCALQRRTSCVPRIRTAPGTARVTSPFSGNQAPVCDAPPVTRLPRAWFTATASSRVPPMLGGPLTHPFARHADKFLSIAHLGTCWRTQTDLTMVVGTKISHPAGREQ